MDTLTPRKHIIAELNHEGHEAVIEWDPHNEDSIQIARETFEEKKKKGYSMFRSNKGEKGVRLDTFDPKAEKIIIVKNYVAG
jgi:hypothetical protein